MSGSRAIDTGTTNIPNYTFPLYDNVKGQKIRELVSDHKNPGYYSAVWNGKDDAGHAVSSGLYFYQMKAGNYTAVKKMILMK